jgi:hypothetical protein
MGKLRHRGDKVPEISLQVILVSSTPVAFHQARETVDQIPAVLLDEAGLDPIHEPLFVFRDKRDGAQARGDVAFSQFKMKPGTEQRPQISPALGLQKRVHHTGMGFEAITPFQVPDYT